MKDKTPQPLFHTPDDQVNKVEQFKLQSQGYRGNLATDLRDLSMQNLQEDSEQLAKSHGIYLEYNRAKTGREKDWMYMVRLSVPGGGPLNLKQWQILDDIVSRYTHHPDQVPSLRLTTRQNVQFHWVKKEHLVDLVRDVAQTGYYTLNGCGDNTRNVMGCPLSRYSNVFNAVELAHELGRYFRLSAEPHIQIFEIDTSLIQTPAQGAHFNYGPRLLNRKFKIGIGAVHQDPDTGQWYYDNCVELRTNDVGIAPILENGQVQRFMVYIGGGQGEKFGKPTFAGLAQPLGVLAREELLPGIDAVVALHQEWGDRKNRHWARLKYVVQAQGIQWFADHLKAQGLTLEKPIADFNPGKRMLHHGWHRQPTNNLWSYGAYIENGRIANAEHGNLRDMVTQTLTRFDKTQVLISPNQDLLFVDIEHDAREDFVACLESFGQGTRHGKKHSTLRVLSGSCVGLPTCRLATTDSERYEPQLLDELEALGYGDIAESVGITGCERQCFRPATKTIGLIGQGPDRYAFKLGGSEDASTQGQFICDEEHWYLAQTPRQSVPVVIGVLFDYYLANRLDESETMGAFHQRVGMNQLIAVLKSNEKTSPLMDKTRPRPYTHPDACDILH